MMRLLVTGGAGFIGSALVRFALRHTAHQIINVDKLTYAASPQSLNEVLPSDRYAFEQADICNSAQIQRIFESYDPDSVVHLAAESHVDRSIDDPKEFIDTNVTGTFVLLEAACRHWVGLTAARRNAFRFHHISTDEVFGSLSAADHAVTETAAYAPNSPYAASKASSDMLVRAWHRTYGLPTVISNCSNNYGPFQFPEKLIPVVILSATEGRAIPIYGTGSNSRDWLFVDDHVRAILAIVQRAKGGECYNIGGTGEVKNIDLVRMLCRVIDDLLPKKSSSQDLIKFVPDRPAHDLRYAINSAKIERDLGWRPSVPLENGLQQTVRWYLANRWWTDAIRDRGFGGERLGLATALLPAQD